MQRCRILLRMPAAVARRHCNGRVDTRGFDGRPSAGSLELACPCSDQAVPAVPADAKAAFDQIRLAQGLGSGSWPAGGEPATIRVWSKSLLPASRPTVFAMAPRPRAPHSSAAATRARASCAASTGSRRSFAPSASSGARKWSAPRPATLKATAHQGPERGGHGPRRACRGFEGRCAAAARGFSLGASDPPRARPRAARPGRSPG
jgi:hypothetical protein